MSTDPKPPRSTESPVPVPVEDEVSTVGDLPSHHFDLSACNPGELQVEILLESHRVIMRRLTAAEAAIDSLAEAVTMQDERARKALRVLQAEIEGIKATLYQDPGPRRCPGCASVLPVGVTVCPGCQEPVS